ncbi:MAG TPA: hypothetical protein VEP28_11475, partial [Rubrobacter sp.]|nr:hypothetical protein [Rubrobacter sp.]
MPITKATLPTTPARAEAPPRPGAGEGVWERGSGGEGPGEAGFSEGRGRPSPGEGVRGGGRGDRGEGREGGSVAGGEASRAYNYAIKLNGTFLPPAHLLGPLEIEESL